MILKPPYPKVVDSGVFDLKSSEGMLPQAVVSDP
jgi:hypothetical protein